MWFAYITGLCHYSFITGRFDYCNSLLSGISKKNPSPAFSSTKTLLPGFWLGPGNMTTLHQSLLPYTGYLLLLELILRFYWLLRKPWEASPQVSYRTSYCLMSLPAPWDPQVHHSWLFQGPGSYWKVILRLQSGHLDFATSCRRRSGLQTRSGPLNIF